MNNPICKVSVIVPNFNHEKYLPKRLDSIFCQTLQNFEVILLDDCSSDTSPSLLEGYALHPKVSVYIRNEVNSGSPFLQWQKGLELAKGEYVWIAESDDYADPLFLETMVPLIENKPNVGIAFCASTIVSEDDKDLGLEPIPIFTGTSCNVATVKGMDFIRNYMLLSNSIPNVSACLLRREALVQAGLSKIGLRLNGDWLVYIRILCHFDIVCSHRMLNFFRTHEGNVRSAVSQSGLCWQEALKMFAMLQKEQSLSLALVRKAVATPLIFVVDQLIRSRPDKIAFRDLWQYLRLFKINPITLFYAYLFRFRWRSIG